MKNPPIMIAIIAALYSPYNLQAAPPEVEAARNYGAKGQVTLCVVDSQGTVVTNASIKAGFYNPRKGDDVCIGQTDSNGLFTASGNSIDDMNYSIGKDGYYETIGKHVFYRRTTQPVVDGRWQPWNPTLPAVLKERRNPVAMYAKPVDTVIPVKDLAVGFDLEAGDWVAPYGKGKSQDILFTYRSQIQDYWTGVKELFIACSNKKDGFYRAKKDVWSKLRSIYEAPTNDYQSSIHLINEGTKDKVLKLENLDESEYLVFRVRTVLDEKGNIVSARYGKIYGPIKYGASRKLDRLMFTYYFNPDGTRNLEFDPGRNLFQWTYTDGTRVAEP